MVCSSHFAVAADDALTPEQLSKAVKSDALTVPTPGELLTAINKTGKPNWQAHYRAPIESAYTSRPRIALNLGGLIADGYIAIEAEDSQQVKNVGKDIVALAKSLGVSENVLKRGKSIAEFAEHNEWGALKEELEATQNEVKQAMDDQHDEELVTLVTLGGWIRGTEVVSGWISKNYTPAAAKLLRQPEIVHFLQAKLNALPEKARNESVVKDVTSKLAEIEKLVSFPLETTPTNKDVDDLKDKAGEMVKDISKK